MKSSTVQYSKTPSVRPTVSTKNKAGECLADFLNLRLAWERVKLDRPWRSFVCHPHLFEWVDENADEWFDRLETRIVEGYRPREPEDCDIPKGGGHVRTATILDLEDEVVYTALVGEFFPKIGAAIAKYQGTVDFAYQLEKPKGHDATPWVSQRFFDGWMRFKERSVSASDRCKFVVTADISNFYPNIDHHRLVSDLRQLGIDPRSSDLLNACLTRWTGTRGRGIPQGGTASDILAKLYLAPIDSAMIREFTYIRYVDDMRVFCRSKREARRALLRLTHLLRDRGLDINGSKSKILPASEARRSFGSVEHTIRSTDKALCREFAKYCAKVNPYDDADGFDDRPFNLRNVPLKTLESTFAEHFIADRTGSFNKTLFRFLLTRLRWNKSPIAIEYCQRTLESRPQETSAILRYFTAFKERKIVIRSLERVLMSRDIGDDFQCYEIVRWIHDTDVQPSKKVAAWCWSIVENRNRAAWLRSYCYALLAKFSGPADLDNLMRCYKRAASDLERAEILAAISGMEPTRRDAFYGRVSNDGPLVRLAIRAIQPMRLEGPGKSPRLRLAGSNQKAGR